MIERKEQEGRSGRSSGWSQKWSVNRGGAESIKNHEESRVSGGIVPQVVVIAQTCVPGVREETVMVALIQVGNWHTLLVDALIYLI